MSTFAHTLRRVIRRGDGSLETRLEPGIAVPEEAAAAVDAAPGIEIAPNDPLLAYLQTAGGAVELDRLELDSPAGRALPGAGGSPLVPLGSGGGAVGPPQPGPRAS